MAKIVSIEISAIRHMTEDEKKVEACINALLPPEEREKSKLIKTNTKGHYGNEITYMKLAEVSDPERVGSFILNNLDEYSKNIISMTAEQRIEGKKLYIRLHKHLLLDNKLVISDSDEAVRIAIKFTSEESLKKTLEELRKRR
ncbi:MAG: RNA-binding domain-containing protein [Fervidicoccaceae archaeon]|jgi:RNA binding exosome subunit